MLSVLISTIDSGITRIRNIILSPRNDVNYVVVHQYTDNDYRNIPEELKRPDIQISQIPGRGLTKSRNHAIAIATGDIALIADDDVSYKNEYFDLVLEIFRNKMPDIALFKIKTGDNKNEYKNYPECACKMTLKNMHSPSSIEIAFKIEKIKNNISFDERFGLGTFLNGGGEMLFIQDAIKKGLNVQYYPFYIVTHPHESQIMKFPLYHKRRLKVAGATYARKYGLMAVPRIFLRTLILIPDLIRSSKNPVVFLYQMYVGCFHLLSH
jgi:glycosyltransferase involved in cell wall biosynthesis